MIVVSGTIVLDTSKAERAFELTRPLVEGTRAEPGNISYEFYASIEEPGRYRVFEEWESQEALEAHSASAHLAAFYEASVELDISSAEIHRYEVSAKTPL